MVCNPCKLKFLNAGEPETCHLIILGLSKFEMTVGSYVYYSAVAPLESEAFVFIETYHGDHSDWLMYNSLAN